MNCKNCFSNAASPQNFPTDFQNNVPKIGFPIQTPTSFIEAVQSNYIVGFAQSPFVDCKHKCIYFADPDAQSGIPSLYRYDIHSGIIYGANITNPNNNSTSATSGCVPVKGCNGRFICTLDTCISYVFWDGRSTTAYRTGDIYCFDSSNGDLTDWTRTSPCGKLYFDTFNPGHCTGNVTGIYEYDPKTSTVTQQISGLHWTNGFGFNPHTKTFYLNDDCNNATNAYYWNCETGSLSEQNISKL